MWTDAALRSTLIERGRAKVAPFTWTRTARHFRALYYLAAGTVTVANTGGPLNATAYWEPSMYVDRYGLKLTVIPRNATFYYNIVAAERDDLTRLRRDTPGRDAAAARPCWAIQRIWVRNGCPALTSGRIADRSMARASALCASCECSGPASRKTRTAGAVRKPGRRPGNHRP